MKYRGYEIKKVKGKRPYECEELQLKANTLEDMIRMISKVDNARVMAIDGYLEAKRRLFQFYCNQVEGEIISNTLNEIKKNHNLSNNKEALLFLVNLYRVK
jgi:hypothetical protein|nr:MAG TPA: hypothetical protein [Caudoviricetes sp.]